MHATILPALLFLATLTSLPTTHAECSPQISANPWSPAASDLHHLCLSQGANEYTFTMVTGLTVPPSTKSKKQRLLRRGSGSHLPDHNQPASPVHQDTKFIIYDNTCRVVNVYDYPSCAITPMVIHDGGLQWSLDVVDIQPSASGAYMRFQYGQLDQKSDDGCSCEGLEALGETGAVACKCAFPANGVVSS